MREGRANILTTGRACGDQSELMPTIAWEPARGSPCHAGHYGFGGWTMGESGCPKGGAGAAPEMGYSRNPRKWPLAI